MSDIASLWIVVNRGIIEKTLFQKVDVRRVGHRVIFARSVVFATLMLMATFPGSEWSRALARATLVFLLASAASLGLALIMRDRVNHGYECVTRSCTAPGSAIG